VFSVSGSGAERAFGDESGGHRWQRIPPTEKAGRVQTSTVTVAVLPDVHASEFELRDSDLEWSTTRGSGAGGQNRNKVETVAVVKHKPTGMTVRAESERSQFRNKTLALALLRSRLADQKKQKEHAEISSNRKEQVGSGQRGDKRRTIRVRDGQVNDHITGRSWRYDDYRAGKW